ncbi:NUDIX hydrolase [Sphingomonas morindae]|uniref:NUDIX hydrolase n=1 Tax=Sphingomonas morindae TaxID=1541170 RepID=A0ABY4X4S1_9SPHN|nr:NUDIX hydrolase [Sphingomonas morindae]USI71889.1 NUDIX hydrolase [Sphingomonas morindae]
MTEEFHGAKLALLHGDTLLAYQRDDRPGLRHAGRWDLPGGGREGAETPEQTVLRELEEEFGLRLAPDRLIWRRRYPSMDHPGAFGWFFAGAIEAGEIAAIRFGEEGQRWAMLAVSDFLRRADAVPALQARVADYLGERP